LSTEPPADLEQALLTLEPRLFGLALRLCGKRHEAEDLVQEAYLRALSAQADFRRDAPLWAWLARILVNLWRNRLRRAPESPLTTEPIGTPAILRELAGSELELRLEDALQRLSPLQRATVLLRSREGFSYAEIALSLGISLESVKVHLHQGRKRLSEDMRFLGYPLR